MHLHSFYWKMHFFLLSLFHFCCSTCWQFEILQQSLLKLSSLAHLWATEQPHREGFCDIQQMVQFTSRYVETQENVGQPSFATTKQTNTLSCRENPACYTSMQFRNISLCPSVFSKCPFFPSFSFLALPHNLIQMQGKPAFVESSTKNKTDLSYRNDWLFLCHLKGKRQPHLVLSFWEQQVRSPFHQVTPSTDFLNFFFWQKS